MRFRTIAWRMAIPLLLLAPGAGAADGRAGAPYEIPVMIPLTGAAAFLGQGERIALGFVERTVNASGGIDGHPLAFAFKDDQSNPQTAVQIASQILAGKPAVLLGSSLVASCRAIAPLMRDGPVNYCFSPGIHPAAGSYVFTSSVSTVDLINAELRYFRLRGWRRIALIVSTDATGQDAENAVRAVIALPENKSMTLVAAEHFNIADVSVSAQIENVKAADAQALIAWSTGTPIGTIFRAIALAGLHIPTATTNGNMTYSQMAQYRDFLPDELYFPAAEWVVRDAAGLAPDRAKTHAEFFAAYDAVGQRPDIASELAWDPAMIVVAALRRLGTGADARQVHDYIEHLSGFSGIDGVFDFTRVPQRGLDVSDAVITRWDKHAATGRGVSEPR